MKILKTIILILLYNTSFAQDTTMYLHSWKKPKKVEKISNRIYFEIELNKPDSISIGQTYPTIYSGLLLYVRTNEIAISIDNEHLTRKTAEGTLVNTSNSYRLPDSLKRISYGLQINDRKYIKVIKNESSNSYSLLDSLARIKDGHIRIVNTNNINSISYSENRTMSNAGGVISVVAVITALVIAPLVSINYKTGNFNQNRYYSVLGGSGVALAVGIPLNIIFSKNKSYKIKSYSPAPSDNNYYSIQAK